MHRRENQLSLTYGLLKASILPTVRNVRMYVLGTDGNLKASFISITSELSTSMTLQYILYGGLSYAVNQAHRKYLGNIWSAEVYLILSHTPVVLATYCTMNRPVAVRALYLWKVFGLRSYHR